MFPGNDCVSEGSSTCTIEKRSSPRTACRWQAVVRLEDGSRFEALVVDASSGGMRILCEAAVEKGRRITVELRDIGGYNCEVRWQAHGRFGVQFLNSPDELSCGEVDAVARCLSIDEAVSALD